MRATDIIIKKKRGLELTKEEIHFIIDGYVNNTIPDYQMSALLMAINFNDLSREERVNLTLEMLNSGDKMDLSSIDGICVDKHSTGGVGDKTSLVIAPIVASCGLKIAKMSGRGLGHTGGTLDKLESIPNFNINVTVEDFFKQVKDIGIAIVGQTANIAPADKKLYALRDVTGTVEAIGLISSSIMSKKLASGAHSIIIDVKVGDGAFMKTIDEARVLANAMVDIGNSLDRKVVAMLTDMDQPLGEAVGNSLEVIEAIETLKGRGSKDFRELCMEICCEFLIMTGLIKDKNEAMALVESKIENGEALEKLRQMIIYQNGDPRVIDDYSLFGEAKHIFSINASKDGYISKIKALDIGNAAMLLGAGRARKEDAIDPVVGIIVKTKVGSKIKKGDQLAIIHSNYLNEEEVIKIVSESFIISDEFVKEQDIILDIVQ